MPFDELQRVIIDTDPGVDDAQAILFALRLKEIQIEAVTTVFGNCAVTTATRNARTLLALGQAHPVPVFMGAGRPLVGPLRPYGTIVHGENGFGDHLTDEPSYPLSRGYAAAEMARLVADNPRQITILALGPLTNVAMAMRLDPTFVENVKRIICMGGIVCGPGNVKQFSTANIYNDPDAARIVFESGVDLTMLGQDVTRHVRIDPSLIEAIRGHCSAVATFIGKITPFYEQAYKNTVEPHLSGFPVHDLLVMAYAVRPELFVTKRLHVEIETTGTKTLGMTVADFRPTPEQSANVTVCMEAKERDILDWYRQVIIGS